MTSLFSHGQLEMTHLTEIATNTRRHPAERAEALLIAHQRWDVGGCLCGWAELGKSHAGHQVDMLGRAGLLAADHRAAS